MPCASTFITQDILTEAHLLEGDVSIVFSYRKIKRQRLGSVRVGRKETQQRYGLFFQIPHYLVDFYHKGYGRNCHFNQKYKPVRYEIHTVVKF